MSSPRRRRVRMPAADRRQRILAAATTLIAERGYWGLSLQDVADACELSQAGLLHHFPSKDALLVGVLEHRDRQDVITLASQLGIEPGTVANRALDQAGVTVEGLLDAVVVRNATQREIVRLYSVLQAESLDPAHPAHAYFTTRQREVLEDLTHLGLEQLSLAAARRVLALLDGLQLQWLRDPDMDLVITWRTSVAHTIRS